MHPSKDPERRKRQIEGARQATELSPEQLAEGERLVREGWVQLSHKYRHIARVPPGFTPMEALQQLDPEAAAKIVEASKRFIQNEARRTLLFMHSENPLIAENRRDLSIGEFAAFKKAGGAPW